MCDQNVVETFRELLSGKLDPDAYADLVDRGGRCVSLAAFGYPLGRNGPLEEALAIGRQGLECVGFPRRWNPFR